MFYEDSLAGKTKEFETSWETLSTTDYGAKTQVGTHTQLQFALSWKNEDAADKATCEIELYDFSITKN